MRLALARCVKGLVSIHTGHAQSKEVVVFRNA
jgi:hypothetical protein